MKFLFKATPNIMNQQQYNNYYNNSNPINANPPSLQGDAPSSQFSLWVGKIPPGVEDEFVRKILEVSFSFMNTLIIHFTTFAHLLFLHLKALLIVY